MTHPPTRPDDEFLKGYDPEAYARPSVTVDVVLLSVQDGCITALLQQRSVPPFQGLWALPGTFVRIDETLDATAARVLAEKIGLAECYLEQLHSFGAPDRDPRMRIITIAYYALIPAYRLIEAQRNHPELVLAQLEAPWQGETGGPVIAKAANGSALPLAFDHAEILGHAVKRLRGKLDYARIAFALLPENFTLRALQAVHEAILGRTLNKPAFRRRMLDTGWIEPTGERESATSFRPAESDNNRATQNSHMIHHARRPESPLIF